MYSIGMLLKDDILYLFKTKLTNIRTSKNISQLDLAQKINKSRLYISNLETGKSDPNLSTLYELASALECDIYDLIPKPNDNKIKTSSNNISQKDINIILNTINKEK